MSETSEYLKRLNEFYYVSDDDIASDTSIVGYSATCRNKSLGGYF